MSASPQHQRRIILLGGPTASGKSALALQLARQVGGEIVNADSMQIYRELPTLTARPDATEEAQCPHHLYGVLNGDDPCSAARWRDMATPVINDIWARGRVPIVVGGTGLYFRALYEGLGFVPEIDPAIREDVRALMENAPAELHPTLTQEDPVMAARLDPGDRQRLARALEVIRSTGKSLAYWQDQPPTGGIKDDPSIDVIRLVLLPPRDQLYQNCNLRFDKMVAAGALVEVSALQAMGYRADTPVMNSLGAAQLASYLAGEISLDDAIERAKTLTRQYAKRQMTWFRNQCNDWIQISSQEDEILQKEIFP